jgi:hypothetical protein
MVADEAHEVHLTVDLERKDPAVLASLARLHGCRFLHLLLDTGTHPSQPMLSWRQATGVETALKRAAELTQALEHQGMKVLRLKIECFGNNFEWVGFEQQDEHTVRAWTQRLARALS